MFGKRVMGRYRTGMISDFMGNRGYGELKCYAENQANWKLGQQFLHSRLLLLINFFDYVGLSGRSISSSVLLV